MPVYSTVMNGAVGNANLFLYQPNEFQNIMEFDIHQTFLNPVEHGEEAFFFSAFKNTIYKINGIFDKKYYEVSSQGEAGVESTNPMFKVASSNLRFPQDQNDYVRVRGKRYRILFRDNDGTGITKLKLVLL